MTDLEFRDYSPFDDSQQVTYIATDSDTGGIETSVIDPFRQGVEIRTSKQRFVGMQPKIWAGNLDHFVKIRTIGQESSFVDYENSVYFEDIPIFDPVTYIAMGQDSALFEFLKEVNKKESQEASIEPITIPYKKPTTEGPFFAHRVAGAIEDGNNIDSNYKNANRTSQFWDYADPAQQRWFLDEGTYYFGEITSGIVIDGDLDVKERTLQPYDDTSIDDIPENIPYITNDMFLVLVQMKTNLNDDFRPNRTRSANANTFVYGRDSAIYGTDSISFLGLTRGT